MKESHFFRLILPDDVRRRNLRIPTKFARKHGSNLSDSVRLKVPSGFVWEVKLRRKDKDILMQDGWAEFMEHYHITNGSFIVFKYVGGSQFHVVIFDLTACEIEYPIEPAVCTERDGLADQPLSVPERQKIRDIEAQCILSGDCEDDFQLHGSRKLRKTLNCPSSMVVEVVSGLRATNYHSGVEVHVTHEEISGVRTRESFDCHPRARLFQEKRIPCIENLEKSTALTRVLCFKQDRPSFVILPGFSHLEYYLYVREKFILPRIPGIGDCQDVNIYLPGLRMWTVGFHSGKGWQQFAVDNNLKAGDACFFELTKRSKVTYRAFVFRDGGVPRPRFFPGKERPATAESFFQEYVSGLDDVYISKVNERVLGRNPSFCVVCDQEVKNALKVPHNFMRNQSRRLPGKVTLKAGGKLWRVALSSPGTCSDSCLLSRGWPRFVKDNDLRRRDICFFELMDETDTVLEVSILKIVGPCGYLLSPTQTNST